MLTPMLSSRSFDNIAIPLTTIGFKNHHPMGQSIVEYLNTHYGMYDMDVKVFDRHLTITGDDVDGQVSFGYEDVLEDIIDSYNETGIFPLGIVLMFDGKSHQITVKR